MKTQTKLTQYTPTVHAYITHLQYTPTVHAYITHLQYTLDVEIVLAPGVQ